MMHVIYLFDALCHYYKYISLVAFFLLNHYFNACFASHIPIHTLPKPWGLSLHLHSLLRQSLLLILPLSLCLCLPSLLTGCLPSQLFHLSCFSLSSFSVIKFALIYCIITFPLSCGHGALHIFLCLSFILIGNGFTHHTYNISHNLPL